MFTPIVIAVLSFALFGILALEFVKWVSKKDDALVEQRRAAGALAAEVRNVGLIDFADFLADYSIGAYPDMYAKIHELATAVKLGGKDALLKNADTIFKTVLAYKLATPEGRAWITALLSEATPAAAPVAAPPALPSLPTPSMPGLVTASAPTNDCTKK